MAAYDDLQKAVGFYRALVTSTASTSSATAVTEAVAVIGGAVQ